jgi:hypothetical protein
MSHLNQNGSFIKKMSHLNQNGSFISLFDGKYLQENIEVKHLNPRNGISSTQKNKTNEIPFPLLTRVMERTYFTIFPNLFSEYAPIELSGLDDEFYANLEGAKKWFDVVKVRYDTHTWSYALFGEQKDDNYLIGYYHPTVTDELSAIEFAKDRLGKMVLSFAENLNENFEHYAEIFLMIGQSPHLNLSYPSFKPHSTNIA